MEISDDSYADTVVKKKEMLSTLSESFSGI